MRVSVKRSGGLKVLAATSTVAQGINFPCELVIIGEDSRFDEDIGSRTVLTPHELLNAAGRAGRAGEHAAGIVLIVPGQVVGIDLAENKIGNHWTKLQEIFSQSDQCLEISDPLTAVLDRIHAGAEAATEIDRYAVARLAATRVGTASTEQLTETVRKTFAAYGATQGEEETWLRERTSSAIAYFKTRSDETEDSRRIDYVAAKLGLSIELVRRIDMALVDSEPGAATNVPAWCAWLFRWFEANPDLFEDALERETLVRLFGSTTYQRWRSDQEKTHGATPVLERLTRLWMDGSPFVSLEQAFGTKANTFGTCNKARRFVLRVVPRLAYVASVPALLDHRTPIEDVEDTGTPHAKAQLSACVRVGLDSYQKAALSQVEPRLSRRQVHLRYRQLGPYLDPEPANATWHDLLARIERAIAAERGRP